MKSFRHRHILCVRSPDTTRAPWAHLWRGVLHFTEGERQWKKGMFLYPCASADTAGILHTHVAQQSCSWGVLCALSLTAKESFICIWDEGRAPKSAFPDLWQEQMHDILWRLSTPAARAWRPGKHCAIKAGFPSSCLLFRKDNNIFGIPAPIQFKGHCTCTCSQQWHGLRGHPANRQGKSYSKKLN